MSERAVAVVGGGISGLSAAHRLSQLGAEPILIEAAGALGGKVVSQTVDGFLVEGGPDSFVVGKGAVMDLATDLGLGDEVIPLRSQGVQVWTRGGFHDLPAGMMFVAPARLAPVLRSSLLTPGGKLRMLGDLVLPRRREAGDESLESLVVRRLGREVLDRIAEPLIAGIHGAEPSSMSVAASFPRLRDMEARYRSLILAARATGRPQASSLGHFASFRRGMGQLTAALAEALGSADVRTNVALRSLRSAPGGGYRLELSDGTRLGVEGVILALPAGAAAASLDGVSPRAAHALAGVGHVATATITLVYHSTSLPALGGSGFVIPALERRRIMGVSYLSNKWQGRVPDEGFRMLRAFVGGRHGQSLAVAAEDQLVAAVCGELKELLGIEEAPYFARVHAWREGLHKYTLGHLDRVGEVEISLADFPGLVLAGAALYGIGLNECIASGRSAAERVLGRNPARALS